MENRHGSGARAGSLGGKGFYIVLFLCAAVVGVSAWIMLTDAGTNVEANETAEEAVDVSGAYVTMIPADFALETEQDVATMAEADTAENEPESAEEPAPWGERAST